MMMKKENDQPLSFSVFFHVHVTDEPISISNSTTSVDARLTLESLGLDWAELLSTESSNEEGNTTHIENKKNEPKERERRRRN